MDNDTDEARLERHRKASGNLGLPPHPEIALRAECARVAALLCGMAAGELDKVTAARDLLLNEEYAARTRQEYYKRRKYNLKDARDDASRAARLIRDAWELLDPSLSTDVRKIISKHFPNNT